VLRDAAADIAGRSGFDMNVDTKTPVLWGVGGAILASTCCVAPVVMALLGIGSATFLVAWLSLRPLFLAVAALFLIGGLVLMGRRTACARTPSPRRLWMAPLIMALCFLGGYNLLNSVVAPRLYQPLVARDQRAVMVGGVVIGAAGQIVPLHQANVHIYMNCSGCAATLRLKLLGLYGVHAASVDWQHGVAQILFDPTRTTAHGLIASIPNQWYYAPRMQGMQSLSNVTLAAATQVQTPQVAASGTALIVIAGLFVLTGDAARRRRGGLGRAGARGPATALAS